MISRRRFLTGVAIALAPTGAAPAAQEYKAQQAGKVYRVWRSPARRRSPWPLLEAFREGLHELGYVEGKNITIELRNAAGTNERLSALADELVWLKVDVILAVNTPAAQAAKKATPAIPIVMTRIGDPVKSGLVRSLARPGGNVTGLSVNTPELGPKRLQLLREIVSGHLSCGAFS